MHFNFSASKLLVFTCRVMLPGFFPVSLLSLIFLKQNYFLKINELNITSRLPMRLAISMKLIWHKSEEMSNQPYCFNPFDRDIFKSFRSSYIFFDSRQLSIISKAGRKGTRRFYLCANA